LACASFDTLHAGPCRIRDGLERIFDSVSSGRFEEIILEKEIARGSAVTTFKREFSKPMSSC